MTTAGTRVLGAVLVCGVTAASSAARLAAADGILITVSEREAADKAPRTIARSQVEPHRARIEDSHQGDAEVVIFDGEKQVMRQINLKDKSYREVTKADLQQARAQVSDALAKMQEQLKNLPPEQRERIEAMMRGRAGNLAAAAAAAKPAYRKVGTDKVGPWTCDKYEGISNGRREDEVCTVAPGGLGVTPADFGVLTEFQNFMLNGLPPELARRIPLPTLGDPSVQGYPGVPVRRVEYDSAGRVTRVTELSGFTRQTFAEATFEVPAGFRKEAGFRGLGR